jgi:hypothetical protein
MPPIAYAAIAAAIAAAIIGFGGGWSVNGWRLGSKVTTLTAERDGYAQGVETCNAKVEEANALGKSIQAQAAADAAKARTDAAAALAKANKRGKAPDSCDAAFDALDKE